jgi:hypothetical protein
MKFISMYETNKTACLEHRFRLENLRTGDCFP